MAAGNSKNVVLIVAVAAGIAACFVAGYLLTRGSGEAAPPGSSANGAGADPEPGVQKVVYHADFTAAPGDEWNVQTISTTKVGDRPQLGPFFPKDSPSLTLKNLPAHRLLRMTCDLYLTRSWDGSSPGWGPSLFEIKLDDERSLIHTTFGNCGFFDDNNEQAFPDNYPASPYPAFTLAAEKQSLGAMQDFGGGPGRTFDCSSVYHLIFTFPHSDPQVVFNFQTNIKDGDYKGYGIANVRVETLPQLATFTAPQLAQLWADLGSGQPAIYYKARWDLISAGDAAVEYISKHYEEKIDLSPEEMKQLAAGMASPIEEKAWAAFYQLKFQGPAALAAIEPALKPDADEFFKLAPSQFERYPNSATQARLDRARWVLEAIHTANAKALKRALAQ